MARVPRRWPRCSPKVDLADHKLTVLEALGGLRERIRTTRAADFSLSDVDALNVVALEVEAAPGARILARAAGLPDTLFEHDGQITKREIRAVTLSSLAPRSAPNYCGTSARARAQWRSNGCWPIRRSARWPSKRTPPVRRAFAAMPRRSACPDLRLSKARRRRRSRDCRGRDAVFVGGGASPDVLDAVAGALCSGGRLVANAVTLETEALLIARHAALGGELIRIAVSRADPVGEKTGWRPAMPVTQWAWIKP